MRSFLRGIRIIAGQTFRDLLNERILYNIFFVSLFLLFFGYMAALLVFGHQDRVMLHFGTMVNALSVFFVAAGAGARTIRQEMEQRTNYLTLSRPLSRASYFYGKWIGVISFTGLNLLLLSAILTVGLEMTGGHFTLAFGQSIALIWVETILVSAFSLCLSMFFKPGLSTMICMAYLFLSHNHEQFAFLKSQSTDAAGFFSVLDWITPNAQVLLMDTRVYYELPLTALEIFSRAGYGLLWAMGFALIGNAFFYRKNL